MRFIGFDGFNRRVFGKVACEEGRVDVKTLDAARQSQPDYAVIVAGRAFATAFPAVHPFAVVRVFVREENRSFNFEKVFLLCKKIIGREDDAAANVRAGKVNLVSEGDVEIGPGDWTGALILGLIWRRILHGVLCPSFDRPVVHEHMWLLQYL